MIDGKLAFASAHDLYKAISILDTVELSKKLIWENSIGFRSLRTAAELNIDTTNIGRGQAFLDYNKDTRLVDGFIIFDQYHSQTASILNQEGQVIVSEKIGSLRKDGSYWVDISRKIELTEVLEGRVSSDQEGIYVFKNEEIYASPKVCFHRGSHTFTGWIDNGEARGSSALSGKFEYIREVAPNGPVYFIFNVRVSMNGRSFRRKQCGCGWKDYRADHTMTWDFLIEYIEKDNSVFPPVTTYTENRPFGGGDIHLNNHFVAREIIIFYSEVDQEYMDTHDYALIGVSPTPLYGYSGSTHTTNYLPNQEITYECE